MAERDDIDRTLPGDEELLDRAPCGVVLTDAKGLILKANSTLCDWLGVSCDAWIGLRRIQDLLTMGGRIFHQTHWAPLLQMQGSVSEVKLDLIHAQGHTVPMLMNAVRRQHGGRIFHELTLIVARDRDRYERELLNARKQAEELQGKLEQALQSAEDRAKFAEQLVGIVSHDLRNPLGAIQLSAMLLNTMPGSAAQKQTVDRIDRSVKRATRLIGDLLDFTQARLGAGLTMHLSSFSLHDCVSRAVAELRTAYPTSELLVTSSGSGECFGDGERLAQALGNLVSNAVTYGTAGTAITVTASVGSALYAIEVHNHGRPIPETLLAALFEPMTRGDEEVGNNKSVGLGLFIVREIVEAHEGQIVVTSSAADGTRFRLECPRHPTVRPQHRGSDR